MNRVLDGCPMAKHKPNEEQTLTKMSGWKWGLCQQVAQPSTAVIIFTAVFKFFQQQKTSRPVAEMLSVYTSFEFNVNEYFFNLYLHQRHQVVILVNTGHGGNEFPFRIYYSLTLTYHR